MREGKDKGRDKRQEKEPREDKTRQKEEPLLIFFVCGNRAISNPSRKTFWRRHDEQSQGKARKDQTKPEQTRPE
jgi:hypothetical protein